MNNNEIKKDVKDIAWCPGCGNFLIRNIVSDAITELELIKENIVMVSGIGQAAKSPHYLNLNFFNGLHGRALPVATGIKFANPNLDVIIESGDGDMYGEGGNHFIHAIRRNPNITVIIHNNMIYGLTKGQASPTTQTGMETPVQVEGVVLEPFNPISTAIALDASFVARTNAGDKDHAKEIIKKAIQHKGFSIVDIFQVCISFNKVNDFKWFKEHTYKLEDDYQPYNKTEAFKKANEKDPIPLGIIYMSKDKKIYEDRIAIYKDNKKALYEREHDINKINKFITEKSE
jgi:2-oxoglutarate/2-oxoacid ferredoxin oxidoreductase subunit beta